MLSGTETIFFGLDTEFDQYEEMLKKANCLFRIRVHLEKDRQKLKLLSPSDFHRTTKKKLFKKNMTSLINQGIGSQTMKVFCDTQKDDNIRVELLILVCFSLSDNDFRQIEDYGLVDGVSHLLRKMVDRNDVSTMMINTFAANVRPICGHHDTGKVLLGLWHSFSPFEILSNSTN